MHIFWQALIAQLIAISIIIFILKKVLDGLLFEISVKRIVLCDWKKEYEGLVQVTVVTHGNLRESRKEVYRKAVSKKFGEKVRTEFQAEPGIMGGFIVKIGSTIYDDSVRDRLRQAVEKR